jgi:prepilin-type N-terminal cleavage/methylation domain-containing protein
MNLQVPKRRIGRRKGFTLIEVVVAVLIIGVALVTLIAIRASAFHMFIQSNDQFTGAWLAELKMQELISQRLPDPEQEDTWDDEGYGDFTEYDHRVNELNRRYNPDWVDRVTFGRFEYHWRKEVVFIGTNFIGSRYDIETWEQPIDDFGQVIEEDDPRESPAARVVRITLTVFLPLDDHEELSTYIQRNPNTPVVDGRPALRLVTYVDPAVLFDGARDEAEDELNPQNN